MPEKTAQKPGTGLSLFFTYVILYGGFIYGCVFRPDFMATRVRDTVTVSVAYGMLLIVSAAVLAILYLRRK
jgi:uncharacterized membrane protein (DUF485 family)